MAHKSVHAVRHERVARPPRRLHGVREVAACSENASLAQSFPENNQDKSEPLHGR